MATFQSITVTIKTDYPIPASFLEKAPAALIEEVIRQAIDQQVATAHAKAGRPYIGSPDNLIVKVDKGVMYEHD